MKKKSVLIIIVVAVLAAAIIAGSVVIHLYRTGYFGMNSPSVDCSYDEVKSAVQCPPLISKDALLSCYPDYNLKVTLYADGLFNTKSLLRGKQRAVMYGISVGDIDIYCWDRACGNLHLGGEFGLGVAGGDMLAMAKSTGEYTSWGGEIFYIADNGGEGYYDKYIYFADYTDSLGRTYRYAVAGSNESEHIVTIQMCKTLLTLD
ncbi:MAG: hypothetical protein K2M44_02450 [Clostridia bacterium]|nr:hypothetical protein [Clostridia bacterium]